MLESYIFRQISTKFLPKAWNSTIVQLRSQEFCSVGTSQWRRLESDLRLFLTVENWCKAPVKILACLLRGGMACSVLFCLRNCYWET